MYIRLPFFFPRQPGSFFLLSPFTYLSQSRFIPTSIQLKPDNIFFSSQQKYNLAPDSLNHFKPFFQPAALPHSSRPTDCLIYTIKKEHISRISHWEIPSQLGHQPSALSTAPGLPSLLHGILPRFKFSRQYLNHGRDPWVSLPPPTRLTEYKGHTITRI